MSEQLSEAELSYWNQKESMKKDLLELKERIVELNC